MQATHPPRTVLAPALAVALGTLARSGDVLAQNAASMATRRVLAEQAQQARDRGDHATALDLARRAGAISMTPSLRLFVAQEEDALGRIAEAFGDADQCAHEADTSDAIRNRARVLATCRALATELSARVGHVVVRVAQPAPGGLRVRVAGEALDAPLWGVPYVVTPGRLVVEASAPGYADLRREVDVAAGASQDVDVRLVAAPAEPVAATPSEPPAPERHDVAPEPIAAAPRGPGAAPWVVVGAGVVSIGVGAVFVGLRASNLAMCNGDACPTAGLIDTIYTQTAVAWATTGVGAALVVGGLVWFVAARPGPARAARVAVTPFVVPTGGAGVRVVF